MGNNFQKYACGEFHHVDYTYGPKNPYCYPKRVRFVGRNGRPGEAAAAESSGLKVGEIYSTTGIFLSQCHSSYCIDGFDARYNSVLFEDASGEEK